MKQVKSLLLLGLVCSFLESSAVLAQDGSHSAEISQVEQMVLLAESANSENRVETAKQAVQAATALTNKTKTNLQAAQDAVKKAQDALNNIDTVKIGDVTQFKADMKDTSPYRSDFMTDSGADVISTSSTTIRQSDKNQVINVNKLTDAEMLELAQYNLQIINAIRQQFGFAPINLTTTSMAEIKVQLDAYIKRNMSFYDARHISHPTHSENAAVIPQKVQTMYDLKQNIFNFVMTSTFADAPSKWGHSVNILDTRTKGFGAGVAVFGGQTHVINMFDIYSKDSGTVIVNNEDPTALQATLTQAQEQLGLVQAEDSKAKELLHRAQVQLEKVQPSKPQVQARVIYRLYHAASEQYFYTKSLDEATILQGRGWKFEGRGFTTANSGQPVYRLYHAGRKAYLYTSNVKERDKIMREGWKYEGVAWYSAGNIKVYRLFHSKSKVHMYTANWKEVEILKGRGWKYEGVTFYTLP